MSWALYRRHVDAGGAISIGVDDELLVTAPLGTLPVACEVTVTADTATPEHLARTEDAIAAIARKVGGRVAATSRRPTELVALVYLADDVGPDDFHSVPLPADAAVSVAAHHDPTWEIFDQYRPVGMEDQSLQDLRVFGQLFAAGDRGGVRPIDHVIVDLADDRVASFVEAVSSVVGPVDTVVDPGSGRWTVTQQGDPCDITGDTWTVRLIAERHGASYDGWGCSVVGDAPRRRRWWRMRS